MSAKKCRAAAYLLLLCTLLSCAAATSCGEDGERIKISVGMWRGTSEEERRVYAECKQAFEREYPQYEVVAAPYVYDGNTIVSRYASGQLPTLFEADAREARTALADGYVKDVSGYFSALGYGEAADGFVLEEIASENGVCGVPASQGAAGMVLNLPLLAKAGVIEESADGYALYEDGVPLWPDTFAEVEEAARKVAQTCGDGVFGVLLPSGSSDSGGLFLDIAYNFGCGSLERERDGEYALDLGSQGFGDAMRWVRNLAQERLADDSRSYGDGDWAEEMAAGRAAVSFCYSEGLASALAEHPSLCGSLAFVPMPSATGESLSVWRGTVYAVSGSATEEQVEGAMAFLQFTGCGPDAEKGARRAEVRLETDAALGLPALPPLPVWKDGAYLAALEKVYAGYGAGALYYDGFYDGFESARMHGEPFALKELCGLADELFSRMLFEATTSNIVTLLDESEKSFTEKYLNG